MQTTLVRISDPNNSRIYWFYLTFFRLINCIFVHVVHLCKFRIHFNEKRLYFSSIFLIESVRLNSSFIFFKLNHHQFTQIFFNTIFLLHINIFDTILIFALFCTMRQWQRHNLIQIEKSSPFLTRLNSIENDDWLRKFQKQK